MKTIFKIFQSDARRMWTNVVAVVVIMGLTVIPCLYAWFNILSNWDPYGEASTSQIKIAIVSIDKGTTIEGAEVNIGNIIASNLKENKSIDWQFVDSDDEAISGVRSGKYYAGFVVEESFSKDMVSFMKGEIKNPEIQYYENEKINAIAPKITSKVKTTVQKEINRAFISTLAEYVLKANDYVAGDNSKSENLIYLAEDKLEDMDRDILIVKTMINAYINIMDSAQGVNDATKEVTKELEGMSDLSNAAIGNSISATESANIAYDISSEMLLSSMDNLIKTVGTTREYVDTAKTEVNNASTSTQTTINGIKAESQAMQTTFNSMCDAIPVKTTEINTIIAQTNTDFDTLQQDLDDLSDVASMTSADALQELDDLDRDLASIEKDLSKLKKKYKENIQPTVDNSLASLKSNLEEAQILLNYSASSLDEVMDILDSYPDMMSAGKGNLAAAVSELDDMQESLENLIEDLEELNGSDQYKLLMTISQTDPAIIAEFISEPVELETVSIYEVENNGSGTAPFYIVLSIWVGSLIMVAIMHTKIKGPIEGVESYNVAQEFFGRYIIFFLIGQLQTILTSIGAIFYVGIQCENPVLLVVGCQITSLVFTLICYSLTFAFEAVGEAAGVVLMVLQVAGAGGTFPIEVMPKVYQFLYDFMPFKYAMMALRECIAGFYGKDYWIELVLLLCFIPVCLLIGIVIGKHFRKGNTLIKSELQKTDLMK